MCTVLLPPGVNPIAVNKYIISKTLLHGSYRLVGFHQISEENLYQASKCKNEENFIVW